MYYLTVAYFYNTFFTTFSVPPPCSKDFSKPRVMVHFYNSSIQKSESEEIQVKAHLGYLVGPVSKTKKVKERKKSG
jgi:hypothetical protein